MRIDKDIEEMCQQAIESDDGVYKFEALKLQVVRNTANVLQKLNDSVAQLTQMIRNKL